METCKKTTAELQKTAENLIEETNTLLNKEKKIEIQ